MDQQLSTTIIEILKGVSLSGAIVISVYFLRPLIIAVASYIQTKTTGKPPEEVSAIRSLSKKFNHLEAQQLKMETNDLVHVSADLSALRTDISLLTRDFSDIKERLVRVETKLDID